MNITKKIADELQIREKQATDAIALLDEGNTVPFIARYRKEATGGLDDEILRNLEQRLTALRTLEERRQDVTRLIDAQGKLTDALVEALNKAETVTEIDDIYRPYRPKRRTRATIAKEKGLEPFAISIMAEESSFDPYKEAEQYLNAEKGVNTIEEAIKGAQDIIAEAVSDNADYRKRIRIYTFNEGQIESKARKSEDSVYRIYYEYHEPIKRIPSHRLLAINRGEKEEFLSVKITVNEDWIENYLAKSVIHHPQKTDTATILKEAVLDSYTRLIAPSIATDIRNELTERSEKQAIEVFKENLKNLLLQPPVRGKVVMGFDPAYRTGCKIAIVDDIGNALTTTVVYPTPPQNKTAEAEKVLLQLIEQYHVDIISIGNGTASKESEIFAAELIRKASHPVQYIMTNEAGASVYSASKLAQNEFPQYDVSLRSAVSIARRLQDPLAELVKIDPKAIGVGQYQHDMNPKELSVSLEGVVENCVSSVGAELNTASAALLSHIAGISSKTAENIVSYRSKKRFSNREELKKVSGIGEKAFVQCAGFLRVSDSAEVLDHTGVHPESYSAAAQLLQKLHYTEEDVKNNRLSDLTKQMERLSYEEVAKELNVGVPTLEDIVKELMQPGRDPRDELPQVQLRSDIMDITYLKPGMILTGTVRNVADFGAFVDIGVHQDGLIHISKLSKSFVKRAMDVISIGDIVKVKVLEVDAEKKRISLERVFD